MISGGREMSGWARCEHCGEQYNERKEGHYCWKSEVSLIKERLERIEEQLKKGKGKGDSYDWD
jgi:hypothetical protein